MAEEKRIIVYTQAGCPPCEMLKMYIEQKDVKCELIEVEKDIPRETLVKIHPEIAEMGFPFSTVDHRMIGDLMFYLESGLDA
jgi:glutaredoxin